jgi:hypothetical protein
MPGNRITSSRPARQCRPTAAVPSHCYMTAGKHEVIFQPRENAENTKKNGDGLALTGADLNFLFVFFAFFCS